jgi:hypothetical protein
MPKFKLTWGVASAGIHHEGYAVFPTERDAAEAARLRAADLTYSEVERVSQPSEAEVAAIKRTALMALLELSNIRNQSVLDEVLAIVSKWKTESTAQEEVGQI